MRHFMVCGFKQNICVFSLYSNPNLYDHIFNCLLTSMATVQSEPFSEAMRASFLFVDDLNLYFQV